MHQIPTTSGINIQVKKVKVPTSKLREQYNKLSEIKFKKNKNFDSRYI